MAFSLCLALFQSGIGRAMKSWKAMECQAALACLLAGRVLATYYRKDVFEVVLRVKNKRTRGEVGLELPGRYYWYQMGPQGGGLRGNLPLVKGSAFSWLLLAWSFLGFGARGGRVLEGLPVVLGSSSVRLYWLKGVCPF